MNVKNSISESMNAIRGKESKDQSAKSIFSYKPIMSNILKYTVEEYKNCSLEEIMECIEGDTIQTGTALIEEDMAKTIRGERNELHTTDEAAATFDILVIRKKNYHIFQIRTMKYAKRRWRIC